MASNSWRLAVSALRIIAILWCNISIISAVEPKPAKAMEEAINSWYEATVNTVTKAINAMKGTVEVVDQQSTEQQNEQSDQQPIQEAVDNAGVRIVDSLGSFMSNEADAASTFQEKLASFWETLPDMSFLNVDMERIKDHLNEWDWDKFAEEMLPALGPSDSIDENLLNKDASIPPECSMTVPEMIRYAGYRCEVHTVETNDGYLLDMHRIPFPKGSSRRYTSPGVNTDRRRPVVFFQHGILSDSACWIANGAGRSLPYLLADAGCDVWLGNVRGSTYSRKHKSLNPDVDEKYWRFTWQNMAQSDLPAMINKALRETGQPSLYYIGHSQGTLIAFARLAEDQLFNNKIRAMFAFGPVSTLKHINSPVKSFVPLMTPAHAGISLFGGSEILPNKPISRWISQKIHSMQRNSVNDSLIYHGNNLFMYFSGIHPDHYYPDRLPVYFSHCPAGTSLHNLIHMGQLVESGKMLKWDHMSESENQKVYGQDKPPEYDVSQVRTRVVMYVGSEDVFAAPGDARTLADKLTNLVHYKLLKGWDHLDFLWGRNAMDTVYKEILAYISQNEPSIRKHSLDKTKPGVSDEL